MPKNFYNNPEFLGLLIQYSGDIEKEVENNPDASVYVIDDNYAVLSIRISVYDEVIQGIQGIVYIEVDGIYTLNALSPLAASKSPILQDNPYLLLNGRGVLVGLIDTGIDYLNEEFMKEDDTTRIVRIWDQTIPPPDPQNNIVPVTNYALIGGTVYKEDQINEAIRLKMSGGDPYTIVPSKDEIGHGTEMACILGGRGRRRELLGAAPDCTFAAVKLQQAEPDYTDYFRAQGDAPKYKNIDIMVAIKYLYDLANILNMPLVIYLPLGSNLGAHDGSNVIEIYIDSVSRKRGRVIVTSTGNEGNSDTHASGLIRGNGEIYTLDLNVPSDQRGIFFNIYARRPDKISLSIVSPSGQVISRLTPEIITDPRNNNAITVKFIYEGTTMDIIYDWPNIANGDSKISVNARDLKPGIWRFNVIGDNIIYGNIHVWLLQRQLLASDTRFLNPDPNVTLTIPGTARNIVTCGYYNQNNNSIVSESGRGFTRENGVKPIMVAGGIDATTIRPGGSITTVSGGSVASAVTAGCCAQLLQWGVVNNNDPIMYAITIQTYLMTGTAKRSGDIYPNTHWGYGMLDMIGVFNSIRGESTARAIDTVNEYYVNNMFIRNPYK